MGISTFNISSEANNRIRTIYMYKLQTHNMLYVVLADRSVTSNINSRNVTEKLKEEEEEEKIVNEWLWEEYEKRSNWTHDCFLWRNEPFAYSLIANFFLNLFSFFCYKFFSSIFRWILCLLLASSLSRARELLSPGVFIFGFFCSFLGALHVEYLAVFCFYLCLMFFYGAVVAF